MNKKNVVLVLLIFITISVLVIAFFGVNPVLPSSTVINSISVYDKDNTKIEYSVDGSDIEISDTYEDGYKYSFYVVLNVDRELDMENLDFKYQVQIKNSTSSYFTLEEVGKDNFSVNEVNALTNEEGFIESYNYYFYYELSFNKNIECSLNISTSRNSKILNTMDLNVFFKSSGTGSSDINF